MNAFNNVCFSFALACCDERRDVAAKTKNVSHLLITSDIKYLCEMYQCADEYKLPEDEQQ
jgi:hypothetical protein